VFGRQARQLAIVLCAAGLTGCWATSQEVTGQLNSSFVGQNVDAMVVKLGPPTTTFKMNNGQTSYQWQVTSETNINTYRGSGTAQTVNCKINAIASQTGLVTQLTTEDGSNFYGESLCARKLGLQRANN
jgi:hypothetical protein